MINDQNKSVCKSVEVSIKPNPLFKPKTVVLSMKKCKGKFRDIRAFFGESLDKSEPVLAQSTSPQVTHPLLSTPKITHKREHQPNSLSHTSQHPTDTTKGLSTDNMRDREQLGRLSDQQATRGAPPDTGGKPVRILESPEQQQISR